MCLFLCRQWGLLCKAPLFREFLLRISMEFMTIELITNEGRGLTNRHVTNTSCNEWKELSYLEDLGHMCGGQNALFSSTNNYRIQIQRMCTQNVEVFPVQAIRRERSGCITPLILKSDTGWMWVVCLKPLPDYALERAHDTNQQGLDGSHSHFWRFAEEKTLLSQRNSNLGPHDRRPAV